jgi:hypothetical protein
MPTAAKKRKGDGKPSEKPSAALALKDLYTIECTRRTGVYDFDEKIYGDGGWDDEVIVSSEDMVRGAAGRKDATWWCTDDAGNIILFDSVSNANLFAAEAWKGMPKLDDDYRPFTTRASDRQNEEDSEESGGDEVSKGLAAAQKYYKENEDGLPCYELVGGYYFDYTGEGLQNSCYVTIKVEVRKATLR